MDKKTRKKCKIKKRCQMKLPRKREPSPPPGHYIKGGDDDGYMVSEHVPPPASSVGDDFGEEVKERVFEGGKKLLEFLEKILDDHIHLFSSRKFLDKAFVRFRTWLNLLNSNIDHANKLYPPLDVAYVWHSYMIRTLIYFEDAEKIAPGFGKHAKNIPWKWANEEDKVATSRKTWEEFASEVPYEFCSDLEKISEEKKQLPYGLKMRFLLEDLKWLPDLRNGWPSVTDPERRCDFLSESLHGYLKWLHMAHIENKEGEGPTIDLDLFWHAHMMNPSSYEKDIEKRYGKNQVVVWHRPKADSDDEDSDTE